MSKSFTFDGTDLSTLNLQVEEYSIAEMATIGFSATSPIYGDAYLTSVNHTTRSVTLQCAVVDTSTSALRNTLATIKSLLNPILGDKIIAFDHEPDRRYIGRMSSMSAPMVKGFNGKTFSIEFVCLAYTQDTSETNTGAATISSDPDTLVEAGIKGSVSRIPVEIYIRNTTGADLTATAITVANDTTNETITWTGTLEDDRWLRFGTLDSDGRFEADISKSDSTGADPEAEDYTDVSTGYTSGDWCRLQGGVSNSFTITGVSAGTLEITYRGRYI